MHLVTKEDAQVRLEEYYSCSNLLLQEFNGTTKSGILSYNGEELPFKRFNNLFRFETVTELVNSLRKSSQLAGYLPKDLRANPKHLSHTHQPTSPVSEQIGERLTSERVRLGLSREDLATKLGIHPTTLKGYEYGAYDLPTPLLTQMFDLGFDIQFIAANARSLVPDNPSAAQTIQGCNNVQVGNGSELKVGI